MPEVQKPKMTQYQGIKPSGGSTGAPLNLKKRIDIIQRRLPLSHRKIIDCGCGNGRYLWGLLAAGADAFGIEYYEEKVREFRRLHPEFAGRISCGSLEQLHFPDKSFDAALLNEVLEHIVDEVKALREIYRILIPDGLLFVFSPNRFYPFETHGVSLKHHGRQLPYYTPFVPYIPVKLGNLIFRYHARNYWPRELCRLLSDQGFQIFYHGYVWQTFENISGQQPHLMTFLSPILRRVSFFCETLPLVRLFGTSQVVIARRPKEC